MSRNLELKLQAEIVKDFNHNYPAYRGRLIAINNNSQNAIKGAINTSAGVKKGVSDLCFLCNDGRVIWIELKVGHNGQQESQIRWQAKVEAIGHQYRISRSLSDFYAIIGGHLV